MSLSLHTIEVIVEFGCFLLDIGLFLLFREWITDLLNIRRAEDIDSLEFIFFMVLFLPQFAFIFFMVFALIFAIAVKV